MCHCCQAQASSAEKRRVTDVGRLGRLAVIPTLQKETEQKLAKGEERGSHVSEQLWSFCLPLRADRWF